MVCKIAVKGLIIDDFNNILILRKSYTKYLGQNPWELPGGLINNNESPKDALLREINEETGLSVNIIALSSIKSFKKDDGRSYIVSTYLCKIPNLHNAPILLSKEHDSYNIIDIYRGKDKINSFYYNDLDIITSRLSLQMQKI